PNFTRGTFIKSKKFVLKFEILPLLQKKVVIDRIEMDAPEIRIVRNADKKTYNFSDILAQGPAPKGKEEKAGGKVQPLSLTVSKAVLSDGKIEFIDRSPDKIKLNLNPIDLSVTGTQIDKPLFFDCSVGILGAWRGKPLKGTLKVKSVIDLFGQKVQIESFQWKMNGLAVDLKGKVSNFLKPN